jgi:hypothetical protein
VEVSRHHLLPVVSTALEGGAGPVSCGTAASSLKAAEEVAAGDAVLLPGMAASSCKLARVQQREQRASSVRYVLVEGDSLVVSGDMKEQAGGAVVSVFSSPLREWETRPFRVLDMLLPGSLQWAPVATTLEQALGSPILLWAESAVRAVDKWFALVRAPVERLRQPGEEGMQESAPWRRCVGIGESAR